MQGLGVKETMLPSCEAPTRIDTGLQAVKLWGNLASVWCPLAKENSRNVPGHVSRARGP